MKNLSKDEYFALLLEESIRTYLASQALNPNTLTEVKHRTGVRAAAAKTEFERLTWTEISSIIDRHLDNIKATD